VTIRFEIPFASGNPRERFAMEISRDGEVSFPGSEERLEYEMALAAFGGQESAMMHIARQWSTPRGQTLVMVEDLGLQRKTIRRLAADWVSHIADVYEEARPGDGRFRKSLSYLYRSIEHDVSSRGHDKWLYTAQATLDLIKNDAHRWWSEIDSLACFALHTVTMRNPDLLSLRTTTAQVRAYSAADDPLNPAWEKAQIEEGDWQLRRFHDVIKAIQCHKRWPALDKTL
jgi:hypothetical protein